MIEDRTSAVADDGRRAIAAAVATRLAPGHGVPLARHLAILAEGHPPAVSSLTDADANMLSACLAARARRDALTHGTRLVTRHFEGVHLARPGTLSSAARSQLYASAGEYCAAIGWAQMGARFGAQALLFADTDALRYRALTVTALGHALNGEYVLAERDLGAAEELFARRGWPTQEPAYALLLAHALAAAARLDVDRLRTTADRMTTAMPGDAYVLFSAGALEVASKMFDGDFSAAHARGRQLSNGSGRHTSHRLMRHFLVCMISDVLVAQGDHHDALTLLEPYEGNEGHGVCFPMQRSSALLRLGRERELLAETDACTASEIEHCLRTLTPLLIRRALAFSRLGHSRRARETMITALLLIARNGFSATPFLMLPHDETRALVDSAVHGHEELAAAAPVVRAALVRVATTDAPRTKPAPAASLTPTERALGRLLASPLSLTEIARHRGVSLNTIKTQVRSIYRKLDVRTRREAAERLTRDDF